MGDSAEFYLINHRLAVNIAQHLRQVTTTKCKYCGAGMKRFLIETDSVPDMEQWLSGCYSRMFAAFVAQVCI